MGQPVNNTYNFQPAQTFP